MDLTMRTAIVLAGGTSTRMKGDKGLLNLNGDTLVCRSIRRVSPLVDEVLLVLGSEEQRKAYQVMFDEEAKIIVDSYNEDSPLIGAITGFLAAKGDLALIIACDMPFISHKTIKLLFEAAEDHDGAFFEWPNGWVEPLLAVYRVEPSLKIARELYKESNLRLRMILKRLPDAKSIPIQRLRDIDPELLSLFDIDTKEKLKEAEKILNESIVKKY